jgi:hypothetical protein
MQTKVCNKCGVEEGLERFSRNKGGKYGVRSEENLSKGNREWPGMWLLEEAA